MSDLSWQALPLDGLFLMRQMVHQDARGRFARLFCEGSFAEADKPFHVRQINQSLTLGQGSVRGLHFQYPPYAENKLITCLKGRVWDVAVDVRAGSPTFLQWHGQILEAGDGCSLLLPPGFAHGFQVLTDEAQLLYLHSADYTPGHEGGLQAMDPQLAIEWPLPVLNLSPRDASHALLDEAFQGIEL